MPNNSGRVGISQNVYDEQVGIMNECAASLSELLDTIVQTPFVVGSRQSVGPVAGRIVDISFELSKCVSTMEMLITASVAHLESIHDDIVDADESGG